MKFFLKCEEAVHVCDKSQYNEAGFFEKLKLRLHILICALCRGHVKQNTKLTETIKSAKLKTLQPEEIEVLKTRIKQEINKGQPS